jgi:hypothetical protein
MKWFGRGALAFGALLALLGVIAFAGGQGWLGRLEPPGEITPVARPLPPVTGSRQILFGDLHAHTTFSFDAFLTSLPLVAGTGSSPPANACDFARHCSALDFWSINDHAENLTPQQWSDTIDVVRQCNAAAGDPSNPDMVTYLGWEWSQIGDSPDTHYGHKNVVILGFDDDQIPARPIAARSEFLNRENFMQPGMPTLFAMLGGQRGRDFAKAIAAGAAVPRCPEGMSVRDLPPDCHESTVTPEELFARLRDWSFPSLVIPHGTTWGLYSPPGSSWEKQLPGNDPEFQRLVEVYSGHGNAEEYRDWRAARVGPDGEPVCPEPTPGYNPACWRAGELIQRRCLETGESAAECEARAADARSNHVRASLAGWLTVPGHTGTDWLDSGQCTDCFQPAFSYRPAGSVQYMLALRDFSDPADPKRFKLGLIGSSDNHSARPGTGYKEFARGFMTEARGRREDVSIPAILRPEPEEPAARSVPLDLKDPPVRGFGLFEMERGSSYFLTGGLVAVHAEGRDRHSVWSALGRQEVYATSGPRILLWFDAEDAQGRAPMGATLERTTSPRFRARALGSFEQQPGCPDAARKALGEERLEALCLGECHNPSDVRRRITRIEIVRIRPQERPGEPLAGLIEDPWLTLPCPAGGQGCTVEFEDPGFAAAGRDTLYYVRAIEEPSQAVNADPLRCTFDAEGRCIAIDLCNALTPAEDDCLDETEQRAWSSPIYVDWSG